MLNVSGISLLPPGFAVPAPNRDDPAASAKEFDAVLLQLLLQQSGLLREAGTESTPFGEMLLPHIARELAAQLDVGFGAMLVGQAQPSTGETIHE